MSRIKQGMSIVEVAKSAGVSTATVSRVVNGLPGVKPQTVAQVRAAITELNYTPQRVHANKRKKARPTGLRTGNIAIVTVGEDRSWLERPVLAAAVAGIQRATQAQDLRLMLDDMPDAKKLSPLLAKRQVDGAVVFLSSALGADAFEPLLRWMQQSVPVVWAMGMEMAGGGVDHVTPDNVSIGHIAYRYLQRLGCERLAFLTANPAWPLIRLRGQAFTNSALDGGFLPDVYVTGGGERTLDAYGRRVIAEETLEQLVCRLTTGLTPKTGLFVANDHTTASVFPMLLRKGIAVGRDLHIVSCDNEQPRLSGMHPRPASIDIGADEVGFRAVHRLLNRIERPHGPPLVIQVAPRLVEPG